MPVDRVAERRALLDIANEEGSLNNESKLRSEIERFQNRYRENKPSIIDMSTDAQKLFREDLEVLHALGSLTQDREVKRLCLSNLRAFQYLYQEIQKLKGEK